MRELLSDWPRNTQWDVEETTLQDDVDYIASSEANTRRLLSLNPLAKCQPPESFMIPLAAPAMCDKVEIVRSFLPPTSTTTAANTTTVIMMSTTTTTTDW